jgi:hypothetical protein
LKERIVSRELMTDVRWQMGEWITDGRVGDGGVTEEDISNPSSAGHQK